MKTEEVQNTKKREGENVREEFNINLKDVKRQLGYDQKVNQKVRKQLSRKTIGFVMTLKMTTVYNIDKYVMDATVARKSTTIKDPLSNKTAEIIYNDFDISVKNPKQYDRLYLYLFPDQFNSFQRLDPVDGVINYPLNNLLSYNIAFVGFNKEGIFWSEQSNVKSGSQGQKVLERISEKELDRKLAKLNKNRGGQEAKLFEELNFIKTTQQNYVVQALRIENAKFRSELIAILFKCRVEQID